VGAVVAFFICRRRRAAPVYATPQMQYAAMSLDSPQTSLYPQQQQQGFYTGSPMQGQYNGINRV
jgi:hypothetical protein